MCHIGGHQRDLVGQALQAITVSPYQLPYVGVLFVRHDARAGGQFIGVGDKAVVAGEVHAVVCRQLIEGGGDIGHALCKDPLGLTPSHLGGDHVVAHGGETQLAGGHLPVQREGAAISGSRSQRVLVGHLPGCRERMHIVHQRLGKGAEP